MASFDRYTQTTHRVEKHSFSSYDSSKAISSGDTVFLPAGTALPADIDDLKIVDGVLHVMTDEEKQAQADAWNAAQKIEVDEFVMNPDAQIEVLGAMVLEQINILREASGMDALLIEDMKTRASEIALARRGV